MKQKKGFCRVVPCAFDVSIGEPKVCWVVTRRCNYSCAHCSTASYPGVRDETDGMQIERDLDEIVARGIRRVLISGGEPLVSPTILELIGQATARGLRTSISTNGSLLTEEFVRLLKMAGLSKITLSLDGPPEENDELRCHRGAYAKAVSAARLLFDAGTPFSVNCLVRGRLAMPAVRELFSIARAYHAAELTFTFPMLVGRMRGLSDTWVQTWKQEDKWLRDIAAFAETFRLETTVFVPRCGTAQCPSGRLVFGKLPETNPIGPCVYLQYAATESQTDGEPILIPSFHLGATQAG